MSQRTAFGLPQEVWCPFVVEGEEINLRFMNVISARLRVKNHMKAHSHDLRLTASDQSKPSAYRSPAVVHMSKNAQLTRF